MSALLAHDPMILYDMTGHVPLGETTVMVTAIETAKIIARQTAAITVEAQAPAAESIHQVMADRLAKK